MSFKTKAFAAAASVALVGGSVALTGVAAHAATPSCGTACIDIFSDVFGDGVTGHAGFLMDSYKQGIAVGTPIILFQESNHDPAQDFTISNQGLVSDFTLAGLISPVFALHYGCLAGVNFASCVFSPANEGTGRSPNADLNAYEIEYAPFGAPTGNCVGVGATPVAGTKVTLQPCGVSGKTVWVVDVFDGSLGLNQFGFGVPLLNGAGTNFSHPFALTYPDGANPVDHPRPQMFVTNLSGHMDGIFPTNNAANEDVNSNQLWDAFTGPVTI